MAIQGFLAMTGAELAACPRIPTRVGWMACHFSSWGTGLSNLPRELPEGSLLILNDRFPICGHDRERIGEELNGCIRSLGSSGLLLDFQREGVTEAKALADHLSRVLPCPVAVTAAYARGNDAAVFLPPLPCHVSLEAWTAPWKGRELWLDLSLDREVITLTDKGAQICPGDHDFQQGFGDEKLHCHYTAAVEEDKVQFSLWRTKEDLEGLIREAGELGIRQTVGLYQELGQP